MDTILLNTIAVMWLKVVSAHNSVDGTPTLAATNMHGLVFHQLGVLALLNQFHQMEIHQLMQLSVWLPMSWRRQLLILLSMAGTIMMVSILLKMETNVHGTFPLLSSLQVEQDTTWSLEAKTTTSKLTGIFQQKLVEWIENVKSFLGISENGKNHIVKSFYVFFGQ